MTTYASRTMFVIGGDITEPDLQRIKRDLQGHGYDEVTVPTADLLDFIAKLQGPQTKESSELLDLVRRAQDHAERASDDANTATRTLQRLCELLGDP